MVATLSQEVVMSRMAGDRVFSVLILPLLVAACGTVHAPATPPDPLAAVADAIASGAVEVIDLTLTLNAKTPVIQLPPPFANSPGYEAHLISRFDEKGPAWYWNSFSMGEHVGTHFDAPCHWVSGKDGPCVDAIEPARFIGPVAVVDVTADVRTKADFVCTKETLLNWEKQNGRIPARAWVLLRTGWSARAADAATYLNVVDGRPRYPGFGKESAEFLTQERDVLGVGTEAIGTDASSGATADPPFPNHFVMHGASKFGLASLTNLDRVQTTGALLIATPLKIERGSGSPVRVIALQPRS